jgi:hypothetical protein
MLFNLVYKNSSDDQFYITLSGANMSSAILYCDANNFVPQQILLQNFDLLLNNPSQSTCFLVVLKDNSTGNPSTTMIYDSYSNVNSWIQSQSNKTLVNLALLNRPFVQA